MITQPCIPLLVGVGPSIGRIHHVDGRFVFRSHLSAAQKEKKCGYMVEIPTSLGIDLNSKVERVRLRSASYIHKWKMKTE